MTEKIELLEYEEKILKRFKERWQKIKKNGWTQNKIAKISNCTQSYFSQCLHQKEFIQYAMYKAVSLESGVSIEDILKMIKSIDSGHQQIDSERWRLLRKNYR